MGRNKAKTYSQPDETTCGPAALKTALEILGIRKSLPGLVKLCGTNKNGTSVKKLIRAANQLDLAVLTVEWATLRHLHAALRHNSQKPLAVIVDYLYDLDRDYSPDEESGHYATVASFSGRQGKIVLFDSSSGGRKSYLWSEFLDRWYDYDYRRIKNRRSKKWHNRLMLILARDASHLPRVTTSTAKLHLP